DGPNGLIGDYRIGKSRNTERIDDTAQLTPHDFERLTGLALLEGFPYTEHGLQTTCLGGCKLAVEHVVVLANDLATLRMPDQYQPATRFSQLTRGDFAGQRALFGLYRRILGSNGDPLAFQAIN